MSFDLTGQTAFVTGARRGIGKAAALALARAGADVAGASASSSPDDDVAAEILMQPFGGLGRALQANQFR